MHFRPTSILRHETPPGLRPGKMLAAIDGNHLTGHGRGLKQEIRRAGDMFRHNLAFQRKRSPLFAKLVLGLVVTGQHGPRPHGIHMVCVNAQRPDFESV